MNNGVDAPDKRVTVSGMAENDLGVQAETPRSVTLTIEDDEDPPTVTLALVPGTIGENGGTTVLTPSLSHPSSEATVVTLLPSADDYTTSAAELTIAAGMTTVGGATLTAVNNETDAPDNEVMVMATAVNSQGIAGDPAAPTLTITDDEAAPTLALTLSANPVAERGGPIEVRATQSHPSSQPTTLVVAFAPVSPAVAGDLSLSGNTTLEIAAGSTASPGLVMLAPVDNTVDAPDKDGNGVGRWRQTPRGSMPIRRR